MAARPAPAGRPQDPRPQDPGPEDPRPWDPRPQDPRPQDPGPQDSGREDPGPENPGPQDPRPLSHAQQRLYFLDRLTPGRAAYTTPSSHLLQGRIDPALLERAIRRVAHRHEVLRSRLTPGDADGEPGQLPLPADSIRLPVADLSREADPDAAAEHAVRAMLAVPFDLTRGPWLRAALFDLGGDRWLFHYHVHHIAFDGTSRLLFEQELSLAYRALRDTPHDRADGTVIRYGDFARRQRGARAGAETEHRLAYWTERLHSAPHVLELPADRPRPAEVSPRGRQTDFQVPRETADRLRRLAAAHRTSLFTVTLAAHLHLLARYGGTDDVLVGVPFDGRTETRAEEVIGFFTNSVPVRGELGSDPTFDALIQQVHEQILDALDQQDVPVERLVDALGVTREPHRNPLFQHWFDLADPHLTAPALSLPDIRVTPRRYAEDTTRFDTELHLSEDGSALTGRLLYATDLFEPEAMERLAGRYVTLLDAASADPTARLSSIALLDPGERREVLRLGTGPASPAAGELTVDRLVDRRLAEDPEAVAVALGERRLSGRELSDRADAIAAVLRAHGAGPERVVAVCLPRGPDLVAALLGVIRSGAAYLPVDPHAPAERARFLVEDSQALLVLADARTAGLLDVPADRVLRVDALPETGGRGSDGPRARPDNLLYVVYTSGSTGRPKGVAVTHRNFANLLRWHLARHPAPRDAATAQTASASFDAAAWEIWTALVAGSRLEICSDDAVRDPAELTKVFERAGVGTAFVPTPLAEQLIREPLSTSTPLRRLLTGGDLFRPRPQDDPGLPVTDHYGPTENTVVATATAELAAPWTDRSIGRPIDGVRAYVVDRALDLVPRGVRGELCLGGAGVARGYAHRPALTAERFLPDPFSREPGARMYRTGDLVRWRPDGSLEFLGRADSQLKVSGHRVEAGEVESVLLRCAGVTQAVVTAARGAAGTPILAAHLVCADPAPDPEELRAAARRELPAHLVPSVFLVLPGLPLTASGKVDRGALPAVPTAPSAAVAPRDPVERAVLALWHDVLPAHGMGVLDDFFAVGGSSLAAVRLSVRVREFFGIDFPVRALFDHRTVAEQCVDIERRVREDIQEMSQEEIARALGE